MDRCEVLEPCEPWTHTSGWKPRVSETQEKVLQRQRSVLFIHSFNNVFMSTWGKPAHPSSRVQRMQHGILALLVPLDPISQDLPGALLVQGKREILCLPGSLESKRTSTALLERIILEVV